MTNAQKTALAEEALELYENGINVHIPKKAAALLFGSVIIANVVTVAVVLPVLKKGFDKFVKIESPSEAARG